MPILHKDRLVGRFDPKLERTAKRLRIKGFAPRTGRCPDDELLADVAVAMRDFMAFHKADELLIEAANPPEFAEKLLRAL
jgi:uncharacterized protein